MQIKQTTFAKISEKVEEMLNEDMFVKTGKKLGNPEKLAFSIEEEGKFIAGITGTLSIESFHINTLAVAAEYQGKDYGTKLVKAIEEEAFSRGAKVFTVSTQDYQALEFYQKLGYEVFGTLENSPFANATKYYLKKNT